MMISLDFFVLILHSCFILTLCMTDMLSGLVGVSLRILIAISLLGPSLDCDKLNIITQG